MIALSAWLAEFNEIVAAFESQFGCKPDERAVWHLAAEAFARTCEREVAA